MLDTFRDNARSWVIQTLIAAITLVFILSFGPGSRGCRSTVTAGVPEWAAKVNDQTVPANVFLELYGMQVYRFQQYGMATPEQLRTMHVREDVMKEVVREELLAQAAEKSGVFVSDAELWKAVSHGGRFNDPETKKFDPKLYTNYTQRVESAKSFEGRIRRAILSQRENEVAVGTVTVSDDEIKAEYLKENEGASIAYVKFVPGNFRDQVHVSPADIDAELKDHLADVQKHFDDAKMLYTEPPAIKARRLFVPVKQDATPAEEEAAKKKIDEAKASLAAGKKWEELAPQFPGDPNAGGDLGWVQLGRSTLGKNTEEAIFKLEIGATSDVVRAKLGFEILQAQERRESKTKNFDDVKRDIATDLVREAKVNDVARAAAEKTLAQLKAGQGLEAQWPKAEKPAKDAPPVSPEEAKKPHAVVTDVFHPDGGIIPSAGSVPKVSSASFALSGDKRFPDAVIEDQKAFWVIELKSRTRADLAKLATDKDSIRKKIEKDKQSAAGDLFVEQLKKGAKIEENQELLSYDHKGSSGAPQPDDS